MPKVTIPPPPSAVTGSLSLASVVIGQLPSSLPIASLMTGAGSQGGNEVVSAWNPPESLCGCNWRARTYFNGLCVLVPCLWFYCCVWMHAHGHKASASACAA